MICNKCGAEILKSADGKYRCAKCGTMFVPAAESGHAKHCKACGAELIDQGNGVFKCKGCGKTYMLKSAASKATPAAILNATSTAANDDNFSYVFLPKCPMCGYEVKEMKSGGNKYKCVCCGGEYPKSQLMQKVKLGTAQAVSPTVAAPTVGTSVPDAAQKAQPEKRSKKRKAAEQTETAVPEKNEIKADSKSERKGKKEAKAVRDVPSLGEKSHAVAGIIFLVLIVLLIGITVAAPYLNGIEAVVKILVYALPAAVLLLPLVITVFTACAAIVARKTVSGIGLGLVAAAFVVMFADTALDGNFAISFINFAAGKDIIVPFAEDFVLFKYLEYALYAYAGLTAIGSILALVFAKHSFEKAASLIFYGIFGVLCAAVPVALKFVSPELYANVLNGAIAKYVVPYLEYLFMLLSSVCLCAFCAVSRRN